MFGKCILVCGMLISTSWWITASHTSSTGNSVDLLANLLHQATGRFVSGQSHSVGVATGRLTWVFSLKALVSSNLWICSLRCDTIRYDSVYLTCSKTLTDSQLSLPHRINKKLKCETKNKMMSMIGVSINSVIPVMYCPLWWGFNEERPFLKPQKT